jgi:hypothetical protein
MKKTIEILVSPEGKTTVQTLGFAGPSCREASQFLEQALGCQSSERLTAAFYQSDSIRQETQQRT